MVSVAVVAGQAASAVGLTANASNKASDLTAMIFNEVIVAIWILRRDK